MTAQPIRLTYIGGPTALIEWEGLRLLTDPTLDAAGATFRAPAYELRKTLDPALPADALGRWDAVLLSHDHHFDNLDDAGRVSLGRATRVLTTTAGAARLGHNSLGLAPWEEAELRAPGGRALCVTGTPARHGPAHADRGPVIGFALFFRDDPANVLYVSGDTVWYDGVQEVSERYSVRTALLFMGAARVKAVGDWPLTFTAEEGVVAARAFERATIVPLHYEGWEHFSESRPEIVAAFRKAGLSHRLRWLAPGVSEEIASELVSGSA